MSPDAKATCALVLLAVAMLTVYAVGLAIRSLVRDRRTQPPRHVEPGPKTGRRR